MLKKEISAKTGLEVSTNADGKSVSQTIAKPNVVHRLNHSEGCGIRCISHVTKVKPNKVREVASANYLHHAEVVSILKKLGFKAKQLTKSTLYPNKKYIVTVPSLNNVAEFHFVVAWCNEDKNGFSLPVQVFDPMINAKKYVSQSKKNLSKNEFRIVSWTSIIEVCP